jgi:hypothetical protein
VFISINNQIQSPADNPLVYALLQQKFATFPLRPSGGGGGGGGPTFEVIDPGVVRTYRVSLGFKYYFNFKLNQNNLNYLSGYIRQSFEMTNSSYQASSVSIKLQQDVIF